MARAMVPDITQPPTTNTGSKSRVTL